jgi:hypothetical protein
MIRQAHKKVLHTTKILECIMETMSLSEEEKIKNGRQRGIRTPGSVKINGFQDRRFRPLSHLP